MISGSVHLPCLPEASQSKLVNWDPATGQLKLTSSFGLNSGGGGADQDLWDSFAVAGQTTLTANSTTDQMTFVAAGGMTITTATDEITFTSANTMGSGFITAADTNTATTTITQGDTLTLKGGSDINTVSNPDGTITINSTAGGADNLGDHNATQKLKMHGNWISSSQAYGMLWDPNNNGAVLSKIYVDSSGNDLYLYTQGASDVSFIRVNDGTGGITFHTDTTNTGTTERMQIHTDGQWDYNSLTAGSQSRLLTYDTSTGTIKHTSSYALGGNMAGAGGGGGRFSLNAAAKADFIGSPNGTWATHDWEYGASRPRMDEDWGHYDITQTNINSQEVNRGFVIPYDCTILGFNCWFVPRHATGNPVASIVSASLWACDYSDIDTLGYGYNCDSVPFDCIAYTGSSHLAGYCTNYLATGSLAEGKDLDKGAMIFFAMRENGGNVGCSVQYSIELIYR
jgi:hypothetical protein